MRKPESVVKEIRHLHDTYGVATFKIIDEMFVLNERHVINICDGLIEANLNLNIWAYARVDSVRKDQLELFKKAGVNWLCLGIESGNQEVRIDAVRRVWEVEGVNEVINEIQIGNRASLKEYAQDVWITTQVRGLAAKTVGLRSVAYNFETIQGKVYIVGITSRPEQLEAIIDVAKTVKGVTEIVNYVIVKE